MRAKTILALCCLLTLLLTGAALAAEPQPAPAPAVPVLDGLAAPACSVEPAAPGALPDLGVAPVERSSCPVSLAQSCYQQYGTCSLCFCFGSSCSCENRCQ